MISKDFIYLYPPGIPLIVPGEVIDSDTVEYAKRLVSLGACAAAAAFPILVAIFGGWWLKILLALMCAAAVIYIYRSGLMRFLAKMKKEPSPKEDGPAAAAAEDTESAG